MELRFFNPYAKIRHTENRLPHWQQENAVYFITFRLADAVPSHLRDQWESERAIWIRLHPEPWSIEIELEYHKRFSGAIERWLDAGHRSVFCAEPIVRGSLEKRFAISRRASRADHISCDAESCARSPCSKTRAAAGEIDPELEDVYCAAN